MVQPLSKEAKKEVMKDIILKLRVKEIRQLIEAGFLKQIVLSTDVCMKVHLRQYGGHGYDHIQKYFVPLMLTLGMTREQIDTILIENPRRMLTFV